MMIGMKRRSSDALRRRGRVALDMKSNKREGRIVRKVKRGKKNKKNKVREKNEEREEK